MAIDLTALRAKIAAQKAAALEANTPIVAIINETTNENPVPAITNVVQVPSSVLPSGLGIQPVSEDVNQNEILPSISLPTIESSTGTSNPAPIPVPVESITTGIPAITVGAGTTRTSEIDHLEFLTKLQDLEEALLTQHPKMPVLLMMIHKQLRTDPELVTTLSEEQIGVIVNGLKIQTKTELVGTIAKQSKARDKKTKLSADMF